MYKNHGKIMKETCKNLAR